MTGPALGDRVTTLEVTVRTFIATIEKSVTLHDELLRKMDSALDEERLARREALTAEREARIAASTVEATARASLASDLRSFQVKIFSAIGGFIFIAQLILSIFGPVIRHQLGVPS